MDSRETDWKGVIVKNSGDTGKVNSILWDINMNEKEDLINTKFSVAVLHTK